MKLLKYAIFTCITFFLALPAFSATVAISDLEIQSDNPGHKYIGKGIAELVSFELGKSSNLSVISREKRSEMMKELSLSMTGLGDPQQQLKLGKMLAARYMISGNVINMGENMLITMKMVDVETGKVVWQDKITEKLSRYDYISAYFAQSALKQLDARVDKSTIEKIEEKKEKDEKAAITFSKAIDSYDKNEKDRARKELQKAKKLDPESEVVRDYISKLAVTSSKFRYEMDFYVSSQNPAALGNIQQDKIYLVWSMGRDKGENIPDVGDGYGLDETGNVVVRVGYEIPLGKKWGLSIEGMFSNVDPKIEAPYLFDVSGETGSVSNTDYFHPRAEHYGGNIGIGYAVNDWLSVGGVMSLYSTHQYQSGDNGSEITLREGMDGSFSGGFMLTLLNRRLFIDSQYTHCMEQEKFLNPDTQTTEEAHYPAIWETTVTGALFDRRLFLVGKQIMDLYSVAGGGSTTRDGWISRSIPSVEFWAFNWLSLRAGFLYTTSKMMGRTNDGIGAIGGLTMRLWSVDIDVNYTYMERVSRLLPGYETDDQRFLIQISKNATFVTSRD